jgi:hypothetical protein
LLQLSLLSANDSRVWIRLARAEATHGEACVLYLERALQVGAAVSDIEGDAAFESLLELPALKSLLALYRTQTSGYIEKETESGPLHRWRRRWFVLRCDRLLMFVDKDSTEPISVTDLGSIALLSRSRCVCACSLH